VTRLADIVIEGALLEDACAGREPARRAIYEAVAPATLSLIRRLVGHRALAEDIFQDTMIICFERLPEFRREAPLGAWLRRIAVSRCLMYLRSPWQRARLCLEPVDCGVGAEVAALITPGYTGELVDLERALATLTPTARAVVWMYEVEGYSHEEIAREFGRSVSFSKSQLARAHRRLHAWFVSAEQPPTCSAI
jgi:DNA-directed RNA polymerase specialized sigma24 family protein